MSKNYEFAHQSTKQKGVLITLRLLIAAGIGFQLYSLGWPEQTSTDVQLRSAGGILIGFWIYANLLRVKVEVQELFVPPIDIQHANEFMFAGLLLHLVSYYLMFAT